MKDTRLNRPSSAKFGSRDYAIEELRAEIASSFYLAEFGLVDDILDDRKAYIQGWSEKIKKDHKVLFEAIKDAEKIVDYIKEKGGYDCIRYNCYDSEDTERTWLSDDLVSIEFIGQTYQERWFDSKDKANDYLKSVIGHTCSAIRI